MQVNQWNAIVAMSENRVIGMKNQLPWHLPEDLAWFRAKTHGQVLVLGRKTLESLPSLRPENHYIVLTRNTAYTPLAPHVEIVHELTDIPTADPAGRSIWICGGSELYRQTLPYCAYLYLTTVKATYEGDTFFPPFEDQFAPEETLRETEQFIIRRYRNNSLGGHTGDR